MNLKLPPHRYIEIRLVGGGVNSQVGPWIVSAYSDDLTLIEYSDIFFERALAVQLQQELQATCRAARRLIGLPTPNLNLNP